MITVSDGFQCILVFQKDGFKKVHTYLTLGHPHPTESTSLLELLFDRCT
jgi:hypothetical protein